MTPGGWKKEKIKYEIPLVLAHQLPLQSDSPSASGLAGHAVLAQGLVVRLPWVPSSPAFGPCILRLQGIHQPAATVGLPSDNKY